MLETFKKEEVTSKKMRHPGQQMQTNDSSQVGALLFGVEKKKAGSKKAVWKDFARANRQYIKDTEKLKKMAVPEPSKPFKLREFEDVESRCFVAPAKSEHRRAFLKKNARSERLLPVDVFRATRPETDSESSEELPRKAPLPKATAELKRQEKNFLAENRKNLSNQKVSRPQKQTDAKHSDFGTLPAYLVSRKMELALEKLKLREDQKDPHAPPGTRKMEEKERENMLQTLRQRQAEVHDALAKLPLQLTTLRQRQCATHLEEKLKTIQKSIDIFDKPNVYVAATTKGTSSSS